MSLEEFENRPDKRTRRYIMMKSITDYTMGVIIIGIGLIIIFSRQLQIENENLSTTPVKIFGGVAIVYGAWRIYRGIKKKYFRE